MAYAPPKKKESVAKQSLLNKELVTCVKKNVLNSQNISVENVEWCFIQNKRSTGTISRRPERERLSQSKQI